MAEFLTPYSLDFPPFLSPTSNPETTLHLSPRVAPMPCPSPMPLSPGERESCSALIFADFSSHSCLAQKVGAIAEA